MRELAETPTQAQKTRLERALNKLQSLSKSDPIAIGDPIPVNLDDAILKGHGTLERNGQLVATWCGVVDRTNNLFTVGSCRSRYKPETGDIVVGRVAEVAQKRWRIDINGSQDGILMLSSVTLPDGIQRRRTAVDELSMRNIFEENDVISAEVRNTQGIQNEIAQLHARSDKYGKLDRGQLIAVPCYLVKKRKQHFHQLDQYGVLLILGSNGYVWVGELIDAKDTMDVDQVNKCEQKDASSFDHISLEEKEQSYTSLETRQNICRIANAVRVLSIMGFNITTEVILETFNLSVSLNVEIHDMLGAEFCVLVAEREAERRSMTTKRKG